MLCNVCNKKQATVHLTEIVDEQMTELHLCEECARKKSIQMEQKFGLSDLLGGLADFGKHIEGHEPSKIRCPNCGLSYEDFKKIGRLGCSNCYDSFIRYLTPLLKRIHGTIIHTGKNPRGTGGVGRVDIIKRSTETAEQKPDLLDLKNKLQEVIKLEDFEEAAKLRDKIRDLESKSQSINKGRTSSKETGGKNKYDH